jgi:PAS domain S-box-containing protein
MPKRQREKVTMTNHATTKEQLVKEVETLRTRIAELESIENEYRTITEALKKSEKRYRELYCMVRLMCDNVPDLIWAKDLEKRFIFANKAICEKLLNASNTDEPIGKTDMYFANKERVSHPGDPDWHTFGEICRDSDSIVMKSRKSERFNEFGNVKGQFLYLDVYKAPFRNDEGEMIGTVGCGREVTRERKIEEELKKSEMRYRAIVEDQTELICRFLPDGTLTFVNDAYCRYFDMEREDLIDQSFMTLIPEEDREAVFQKFNSLTPENRVATYEHRVIKPDRGIHWMRWTDQAIYDDRGQLIEYQSVGWDITERKKMEEELQKAKNELEHQVQQRTAELSLKNTQLIKEIEERRQAQKDLQEAFSSLTAAHKDLKEVQMQLIQAAKMESVGILAAGIAHEVKNPLATILMGIEYLADMFPSRDANVTYVLRDMEEAVTRADTMVRGLLDFSSKNEVEFEKLQLNDIIIRSVNLVRHEIDKKNIRLLKDLHRHLPRIQLDEDKICQVFVNVFLNSVQALPEGGTMTVRTYEEQLTGKGIYETYVKNGVFTAGEKVIIAEVEDMGTGIPDEQIKHVFDPFFTTKPIGEGAGLGLTVSKNIMESHGGRIDIMNREEGGVKITAVFKME